MKQVLVDSNVILDIVTLDPYWYEWSLTQLVDLAEQHVLVINPIIYAEISVEFATIEEVETMLNKVLFLKVPLPWNAAFLAGKIYKQYKKKGGTKNSTMPDFFIGAHALIENMIVLTRDPARYRTYYPKLQLVAPN